MDSKAPNDQAIVADAPTIDAYLTAEASEFFAEVTEGLDACDVPWTPDSRLVRGFDYYRHTAFEFVTDRLGAQGTVLGGGRFDGLIEALGGQPTPAVGWAAGIERLGMLLGTVESCPLEVVVIAEDPRFDGQAIKEVNALRRAGVSAEIITTGSRKKRFDKAKKCAPAIIRPSASIEVSTGNFKEGPIDHSYRLLKPEFDQDRLKKIRDIIRDVGGFV